MAIEEFNLSQYDYSLLGLKILMYGPPGSGKTWFIGTMPGVYIVSLDKGLIGLRLAGVVADGCTVDTFDELQQVVSEIAAGTRAPKAKAIALDHLSAVTDLAVTSVKMKTGKKAMDRSTWGTVADYVRMLTKQFADIADIRNVHVCVAAHEKIEKNEIIGSVLGTPDTVGKFAMSVGGLFDLYLYSRQEVGWEAGKQVESFTVNTVDYQEFKAKDRTGVLETTEPNDFPIIYAKIKERIESLKKG